MISMNNSGFSSSSALILAGGKSSRFGADKAFAEIDGKTLIEHIISLLEPHFKEIIISAQRPSAYMNLGCSVCSDILPGLGPLAGIHSGLQAASDDYVFVIACDMPILSKALITQMRKIINEEKPEAVVPGRSGFIEPFHGFYSKRLIPKIEKAAAGGTCGVFKFLKMIKPSVIDCLDEKIFYNINTPADLEKLSSSYL